MVSQSLRVPEWPDGYQTAREGVVSEGPRGLNFPVGLNFPRDLKFSLSDERGSGRINI